MIVEWDYETDLRKWPVAVPKALHDALADLAVPVIEVHLSNIYAREPFRRCSVTAGAVKAQFSGLGWYGYVAALDYLVDAGHNSE